MSSWDKLIARLYTIPADMQYKELQKILLKYGYQEYGPHGGSSHHTFRKAGCAPITIPAHSPIKKVYVRMVKELVEKEDEDK